MPKHFAGFVLPLKREYLTAIGAVVAQWGVFETDFDRTLAFFRLAPHARALEADVPKAFSRRVRLFKNSARACFPATPTLAAKFTTIAGEAKSVSRERNLIAHGRWGVGRGIVRAYSQSDQSSQTFTLESLTTLRDRISEIHWRMLILRDPWPNKTVVAQFLTSDEISALQEHRSRNYPRLPTPVPSSYARPLSSSDG